MTAEGNNRAAFDPRVMGAVIVVGIIGFIAMWALMALGPQLSRGNDGAGHALSKGAAGYAAVVDLAERAGVDVTIRRKVEKVPLFGTGDDWRELLVLTPTQQTKPGAIADILIAWGSRPTMIVLPKWTIMGKHPDQKGWAGPAFPGTPSADMLPNKFFGKPTITMGSGRDQAAPAFLTYRYGRQTVPLGVGAPDASITIAGGRLDPLVMHPGGGALVARVRGKMMFVVSDPDLINNLAFSSREGARGALTLLDAIAQTAEVDGLAWDVTLNGFGNGGSFLRFAFVPPFLGITLCLIAAGLMALWQAAVRFGPALKPARAIAISKAALIDSSAELVLQTGREMDGGAVWLRSLREALARGLHAPAGLTGDALDQWIEARQRGDAPRFGPLARGLMLARNRTEFVGIAQTLHNIRKDMLRDN